MQLLLISIQVTLNQCDQYHNCNCDSSAKLSPNFDYTACVCSLSLSAAPLQNGEPLLGCVVCSSLNQFLSLDRKSCVSQCPENSQVSNGECTCYYPYYISMTSNSCQKCSIQDVNGFCVDKCPFDQVQVGTKCQCRVDFYSSISFTAKKTYYYCQHVCDQQANKIYNAIQQSCIQTCPAPFLLQSETRLCACPVGKFWNSTHCVSACLIYDSKRIKCVLSCSFGHFNLATHSLSTYYNTISQICTPTSDCGPYTSYDPTTKTCSCDQYVNNDGSGCTSIKPPICTKLQILTQNWQECTADQCPALVDSVCYTQCQDQFTNTNGNCQCAPLGELSGNKCTCIKITALKPSFCLEKCPNLSTLSGRICVCNANTTEIDGACVCKGGTYLSLDKTKCGECGENQINDGGACKCSELAVQDQNACKCKYLMQGTCLEQCPVNSTLSGNTCKCNSNTNQVGTACVCKSANCNQSQVPLIVGICVPIIVIILCVILFFALKKKNEHKKLLKLKVNANQTILKTQTGPLESEEEEEKPKKVQFAEEIVFAVEEGNDDDIIIL
ncbi:Conserved_hypothetical protein [Hexamita inflata]|uniref:Uncharacterized protein n=1 Tax=Hexamita inflata TaxID=28002 RepID=A0AA86U4F6_9EUKA|nr:Conserved hypothetical protein [Hexamita inflata]